MQYYDFSIISFAREAYKSVTDRQEHCNWREKSIQQVFMGLTMADHKEHMPKIKQINKN
jgi:hypothetical protein